MTTASNRSQFPRLPVVDAVERHFGPQRDLFDGTLFVCVQHVLETTGSLIEAFIRMGARPEHIFLLGKMYSMNNRVAARLRPLGVEVARPSLPISRGAYAKALTDDISRLWHRVEKDADWRVIRQIVVVDDGGHALRNVPPAITARSPVAGVEQTTSGLKFARAGLPIVAVAASAAKRWIEPPLVVEALLEKVAAALAASSKQGPCGVVGLGNIGSALAAELVRRGHEVIVHDRNRARRTAAAGATWCGSLQEVFDRATCVFGCTGEDLTKDTRIGASDHDRWLVSCSSGEEEFLSLVRRIDGGVRSQKDLLSTLRVQGGRARVRVARGGFPANFDGSRESVEANKIQITRALMLAGTVQALEALAGHRSSQKDNQMLAPSSQQLIVKEWSRVCRAVAATYPEQLLQSFDSLRWVDDESSGTE